MLTFAKPQTSFIANTPEQNAQTLADYLLDDVLHQAKNIKGKNFRLFLEALAEEVTREEQKLEELVDQYYPAITTELIVEWERAMGIPDECFTNPEKKDIEFRRKSVIAKLAKMNLTTNQDFIDLAAFFGVDVSITNGFGDGSEVFPFTFPFTLVGTGDEAGFIMIVTFLGIPEPENIFPMTFPFTFDPNTLPDLIECLFEKLKPAPVRIIFRFEL